MVYRLGRALRQGRFFELKNRLADKFPTSVARALRVKQGGRKARVMEFNGPQTDRQAAKALMTRYYEDFLKAVEARKKAAPREIPRPKPWRRRAKAGHCAGRSARHGSARERPLIVKGPAGMPNPGRTAA